MIGLKQAGLLAALLIGMAPAAALEPDRIDALAAAQARASLPMLRELLSIPNDANYPGDIEKNIRWSERAFGERGFTTARIVTPTIPLLLAERVQPGADRTVLIYLQLDGQPVDPSRWYQESPWEPTLKRLRGEDDWETLPWEASEDFDDELRVFARSASDAKGPVAMFLAALDAIAAEGIEPNFSMKVIMDFEEELGSPRLPQAVIDNRELLAADMLVIFDGPRHITNRPTLTFGARGIAELTLTTYGPVVPSTAGTSATTRRIRRCASRSCSPR